MYYFVFVCIVCFTSLAWADVTLDQLIQSAKRDANVQEYARAKRLIGEIPRKSSLLDKMEFRIQRNQLDEDGQTYSLRLYPHKRRDLRYKKETIGFVDQEHSLEVKRCLQEELKVRYLAALDYIETKQQLSVGENLRIVYEDLIHVLKQQQQSDFSVNIRPLISAENDKLNQNLSVVMLKERLDGQRRNIIALAGSSGQILFDEMALVSVEEIQKSIRRAFSSSDLRSADLDDRKLSVDRSEARYKLEKQKSAMSFSFFQVSYDDDTDNSAEESTSLEIGFTLPHISPPNRGEILDRQSDYLIKKSRYLKEQKKLFRQTQSTINKMWELIRKRDVLNKNDNVKVFDPYMKIDGIDPVCLLKIRESALKNELHLIEINYSIYRQYIELMDMTGRLSAKPLKNLLTAASKE